MPCIQIETKKIVACSNFARTFRRFESISFVLLLKLVELNNSGLFIIGVVVTCEFSLGYIYRNAFV